MIDCGEYEKMIEIPLASCEYVHKRKSRLLKKGGFIKAINLKMKKERGAVTDEKESEISASACLDCADRSECSDFALGEGACECGAENGRAGVVQNSGDKPKAARGSHAKGASGEVGDRRFDRIISAQLAVAFLLVAAILLTNVFWENSGMNSLFKSVFGINAEQTDDRVYTDFSLNLPVKGEGITYTEGVISVSGERFVYPVCDGTVDKVELGADGKYTVTINHSESFKSVIEGADFVCFESGEAVNPSVPVCHTQKGVSVYLYDDGDLITDYVASEDSIVWEK